MRWVVASSGGQCIMTLLLLMLLAVHHCTCHACAHVLMMEAQASPQRRSWLRSSPHASRRGICRLLPQIICSCCDCCREPAKDQLAMPRKDLDPFSDERSPIMSDSSAASAQPPFKTHFGKRGDWSHEADDPPAIPEMNAPGKILVG